MFSRIFLVLSLFSFSSAFAQTFSFETLPASGFSVSGDFNRDGLPDIAVVNSQGDGALYVYLGVGNGNFNLADINHQIPASVNQVLTADMNGDGKLDLIFATGSSVFIFYGDGKGNFSFGKSLPVSSTVRSPIQLGDVNNDGRVDVVSGGIVMLNKGGGVFTKVTSSGSGSVLADVTGDGKLDLISVSTNGIAVSKGYGTGKFAAPYLSGGKIPNYCPTSTVCSVFLNGFTVADLYNNGKMDVATLQEACDGNVDPDGLNCYEAVRIFKNNGSGSFSFAGTIKFTGSSGSTIAAADVNGDALQDIAISSPNVRANRGEFLLGHANGTFTVSENGVAWAEGFLDFIRDLGLTSRQDFVATVGPYAGPFTEIDLNTTPVVNCPPPNSSVLAARICSPFPGSSPASVLVRASGNSPAGVARLEVWIDGVKKGQNWADQLSKAFTISAGTHNVTVVAVDKYTGTAKSSVRITVP